MEHGVVRDWNDMERIWQYIYSKDQLQTFAEEVSSLSFPLEILREKMKVISPYLLN